MHEKSMNRNMFVRGNFKAYRILRLGGGGRSAPPIRDRVKLGVNCVELA